MGPATVEPVEVAPSALRETAQTATARPVPSALPFAASPATPGVGLNVAAAVIPASARPSARTGPAASVAQTPVVPAVVSQPVADVPNVGMGQVQPTLPSVGAAAPRAQTSGVPRSSVDSSPTPDKSDCVEWYVGIAGSPVGPIASSAIFNRIAGGQVNGDSLVWREGLDQWHPLRTFPELSELLASALRVPRQSRSLGATTSSTGDFASQQYQGAAALPARVAHADLAEPSRFHADAPTSSDAASTAAAAAPKAAGYRSAGQVHTSGPAILEARRFSSMIADPSALRDAPTEGVDGIRAAMGAIPAVAEPAKPDEPRVAVRARKSDRDSEDDYPLRRRRQGTHPMAYAFVASAMVFGGVAAYFVFAKPAPPPQIIIVQQTPATATAPPEKVAVDIGPIAEAPSSAPGPRQAATSPRRTSSSTQSPSETFGTANGASLAPVAPAPANPGAGQLTQGEIAGVVTANQPMVKRRCWQPALEARPVDSPTNVRVMASMVIDASGNVESVNATGGDKDFPGLSACIASRIRNWKFPPSGSTTSVNVPFLFAGQ